MLNFQIKLDDEEEKGEDLDVPEDDDETSSLDDDLLDEVTDEETEQVVELEGYGILAYTTEDDE